MNLEKIERELVNLRKAVEYNNRLLTELTLSVRPKEGSANEAIKTHMETLKNMFSNLPIDPEIKKGLNDIFDKAGGMS